MLQNNLNKLMSERNIKASDIYRDLGIARSTILSLAKGSTGGIQFETLERLCTYFDVLPTDFFEYSPYVLQTIFNTDIFSLNIPELTYSAQITKNVYQKNFKIQVTWQIPTLNSDFPKSTTTDQLLFVRCKLINDLSYTQIELDEIIKTFSPILKRKFFIDLTADIVSQLQRAVKKNSELIAYDPSTDQNRKIKLLKNKHCIIELFKGTSSHKLIDITLGTDELTL